MIPEGDVPLRIFLQKGHDGELRFHFNCVTPDEVEKGLYVPFFQWPPYQVNQGLPAFWKSDASGELSRIVMRYLNGKLSPESGLGLFKEYLIYYIFAPMWEKGVSESEEGKKKLTLARHDIIQAQSDEDIREWIGDILDLGLDPL